MNEETERSITALGRGVDHPVTTDGDRGRGIGTDPGKDETRMKDTGVVNASVTGIATAVDGTDVIRHRPGDIPVHKVMTYDIEIPKQHNYVKSAFAFSI